ncbi:hypothetical protein [uncultured Arenimonas sp.]|uniref:hypothetical protein n=1 Tax=uncultured Arenimonas sp. TaxID=546226 RepID=UPI0030D7CAD8
MASLGLIAMTPAMAESDFSTGATPSASARVDFEVNIPRFIRFQVGSAGATIDEVVFDVAAANVGDGTDVAATTNGTLAVSLTGNVGTISLDATTTAALTDGPDTISWAEILTSSSDAALDVPAIVDAGTGGAEAITANVGTRVVARTADWTFGYDNSAVYGAGTYTGRVTFTAANP